MQRLLMLVVWNAENAIINQPFRFVIAIKKLEKLPNGK